MPKAPRPETVTERCIEKEGTQQEKRMPWRGARHPESVVQNNTSFGMRQRDATHALSGGGPIRPVSNSPSHWYWRGCLDDPKQTANTRAPTLPIQLWFYYNPLGRICKWNLLACQDSVICAEISQETNLLLR